MVWRLCIIFMGLLVPTTTAAHQGYNLDKTTTNHDSTPASQPTDRVWVEHKPDGSFVVKTRDTAPGVIQWEIWPREGKAHGTALDSEQLTEIAWQAPPRYWSADRGVDALAISIGPIISPVLKSNVPIRCGARYVINNTSALIFSMQEGINPMTPIGDPFAADSKHAMLSGGEYGMIRARPVHDINEPWTLSVELSLATRPIDDQPPTRFTIHYHFAPAPGDSEPPHADRTFGKLWDTTWGRIAIRVQEMEVVGIYESRNGEFRGKFSGTQEGNVIQGKWADIAGQGSIRLTLSEDGWRMTGTHDVIIFGKTANSRVGPSGMEAVGSVAGLNFPASPTASTQATSTAPDSSKGSSTQWDVSTRIAIFIAIGLSGVAILAYLSMRGRSQQPDSNPKKMPGG